MIENTRDEMEDIMNRKRTVLLSIFLVLFSVAIYLVTAAVSVHAQAGFEDNRVMLQGFYWESYRHGHPEFPRFGEKTWYQIVTDLAPAMRDARFDLIWLPPPSFSGNLSAGYNPKEYFNLNNSYGNFKQHRTMLTTLLNNGIEPVADIVVNHRDGVNGWADFRNPDWGTWAITRDDEAFTNPASEVFGTPEDQRGAPEERPIEYTVHGGTSYAYDSFRDIDHTNEQVRRDIIRYLLQLRSMGYRGWRYDMVHGFHARWIAVYNRATQPTFSVGEYDWGAHDDQRGWIWHTAANFGDLATASSVFDFSTFFILKDNKENYTAWYGHGSGIGMVGDLTDGHRWRDRAVTFLENHDTGYRTNEDGTPQQHHEHDSFAVNWEVEQAYAHILTHPGVPTVYWKHYFDHGTDLQNKIRALINARKVAGVHAGSALHLQSNARMRGVYGARIVGRNGDLYVRIGGSDIDWQPYYSGYRDYREYAQGDDWKVWVGLPENPSIQDALLNTPLPIPKYRKPAGIDVPDAWLN
jgi:alpha-amylase